MSLRLCTPVGTTRPERVNAGEFDAQLTKKREKKEKKEKKPTTAAKPHAMRLAGKKPKVA